MSRIFPDGSWILSLAPSVGVAGQAMEAGRGARNPKVNFQIPGRSKLAVANLVRHRHAIFSVQVLVETFAPIRIELDAVCGNRGSEESGGSRENGGKRAHREGS